MKAICSTTTFSFTIEPPHAIVGLPMQTQLDSKWLFRGTGWL